MPKNDAKEVNKTKENDVKKAAVFILCKHKWGLDDIAVAVGKSNEWTMGIIMEFNKKTLGGQMIKEYLWV